MEARAKKKENKLCNAWKAYTSTGSIETRNKLIEEYLPLVSIIASKVSITLPAHIEVDDLKAVGVLGLINAIDRFDASRGFTFKTFAHSRVFGAMMDWLRSMDWVPRTVRQKAKNLDAACSKLEQELGRTPTDRELARELNVGADELHKLMSEVSGLSLLSLEHKFTSENGEGSVSLLDMVESTLSVNPVDEMEDDEFKKHLTKQIDSLPEKEKLVLALYYYEELTLKEIGAILDLSESRISQIHTAAILKLKVKMTAPAGELVK